MVRTYNEKMKKNTVKGKKILFLGRFQPFHLGHYKVIEEVVDAAEYLIVAVGSSKKSFTRENPFTCGERLSMIWRSLKPSWREKCLLVPIDDINRYNLWVNHVEDLVPDFDVVVSNSELTRLLFAHKGYSVYAPEIFLRENYRGQNIRALMCQGDKWMEYVPQSVVKTILEINGVERIKKTK